MSHNANEMNDFALWFAKQNYLKCLTFQAVSLFPLRNNLETYNYKEDPLWPKRDMKKKINELIGLKEKGYLISNSIRQLNAMNEYFRDPIKACKIGESGCPVRYTTYFIEADKRILNCPLFDPIGDINQDSSKIWNSEKAKIMKEQIKNCKRTCQIYFNCCYEDKTLVKYPTYCNIYFTYNLNKNPFIISNNQLILKQKSPKTYEELAKFVSPYIKKINFFIDSFSFDESQLKIIKQ